MSLKILLLGANGFIGSNLSEFILRQRDWSVFAMDIQSDKLDGCLGEKNFTFVEGDITINREWIEYHIKKCDLVIPLVAIATPASYVREPLRVFELDFQANLRVIRDCVRYGKRVVFPSTSEVYGMNTEREFDEETSNFVLGPVAKQRWIYACSKQLMDRVIYAYGEEGKLDYTLFRPFNWIGPRLDNIWAAKEGSSRVLTQFIGNIIRRENIQLVDGGSQRRCFLYIDDAIDALIHIIENKDGKASKRIFNIGNAKNDLSIRELAELLVRMIARYPGYENVAKEMKIVSVGADEYYGKGYQDIALRVPAIRNAERYLGWRPVTDLETAVKKTLDYYLVSKHPETGDLDASRT